MAPFGNNLGHWSKNKLEKSSSSRPGSVDHLSQLSYNENELALDSLCSELSADEKNLDLPDKRIYKDHDDIDSQLSGGSRTMSMKSIRAGLDESNMRRKQALDS